MPMPPPDTLTQAQRPAMEREIRTLFAAGVPLQWRHVKWLLEEMDLLQGVIVVARKIHTADLAALEELKGLGVEPSEANSGLVMELSAALQQLDDKLDFSAKGSKSK